VNQPLYHQVDPTRVPGGRPEADPTHDHSPEHRPWGVWIGVMAVAAVIVVLGAVFLVGGAADPIEEVAIADVTKDAEPAAQPEGQTVMLSGDVGEILTESALTVTDEGSDETLLVLLTPATIVNGTAPILGGQPGGIGQVIPPAGTLQVFGTIDTFDSGALAERFGIVLNPELFASWEGDPVLIADQVETFAPDADLAAGLGSE
jgi:hypothetical protein